MRPSVRSTGPRGLGGPRGFARAVGLARAAAPSRAPRTQGINKAMNASKSLLSDNSRRFCRVNANCGGSKSRLESKKSKKCSEKAICSRNGSIGIQGQDTRSRSKARRRQGEGPRAGCSHRASVVATGGRHRQAAGCRAHGPGVACPAPPPRPRRPPGGGRTTPSSRGRPCPRWGTPRCRSPRGRRSRLDGEGRAPQRRRPGGAARWPRAGRAGAPGPSRARPRCSRRRPRASGR